MCFIANEKLYGNKNKKEMSFSIYTYMHRTFLARKYSHKGGSYDPAINLSDYMYIYTVSRRAYMKPCPS